MLKWGYLPLIIAVIDIIMYIVYSKRLGRAMKPSKTTYMLIGTFIMIYILSGNVINVSKAFAISQVFVTYSLAASIQDTYKYYEG